MKEVAHRVDENDAGLGPLVRQFKWSGVNGKAESRTRGLRIDPSTWYFGLPIGFEPASQGQCVAVVASRGGAVTSGRWIPCGLGPLDGRSVRHLRVTSVCSVIAGAQLRAIPLPRKTSTTLRYIRVSTPVVSHLGLNGAQSSTFLYVDRREASNSIQMTLISIPALRFCAPYSQPHRGPSTAPRGTNRHSIASGASRRLRNRN